MFGNLLVEKHKRLSWGTYLWKNRKDHVGQLSYLLKKYSATYLLKNIKDCIQQPKLLVEKFKIVCIFDNILEENLKDTIQQHT